MLNKMDHLQKYWEDLLQMARDFNESVTFRHLSALIDTVEETADKAWS